MIIRDVHCTHAMFEIFSLRVVHRLRARIAAIECLAPLPSALHALHGFLVEYFTFFSQSTITE